MKITFIGDVHGQTDIYQKMLRQKFEGQRTVQIGDMGIGFKGVGLHRMPENHKWFRGNHDDPAKCRQNPNYLGDYGFFRDENLFWLAGGFSIDRIYRVPGVTWWEDEELSWTELQKAIDLYKEVKPRFMCSHEAPSEAAKHMLLGLVGNSDYFAAKMGCTHSRTAEAMQVMLDAHQPEEWIFGHYHVNKSFAWKGTLFRCVAPMDTYTIETSRI